MKKIEAEILNAIPKGLTLEDYFKSLDIFSKREILNELEVCKSHFSKNLKRNILLVFGSYFISFLCYFGIRELWFFYYFLCINVILSLLLFLNIRSTLTYYNAIKKLTDQF